MLAFQVAEQLLVQPINIFQEQCASLAVDDRRGIQEDHRDGGSEHHGSGWAWLHCRQHGAAVP